MHRKHEHTTSLPERRGQDSKDATSRIPYSGTHDTINKARGERNWLYETLDETSAINTFLVAPHLSSVVTQLQRASALSSYQILH